MPAVRPATLWLSVAATAISAVAVAAMAHSGGVRRPLTFAGAILLPDSHSSAVASTAANPSSPGAPRTSTRTAAAPSAASTPAAYQQPAYRPAVSAAVPAENTSTTQASSGIAAQSATRSAPAAAGAPDPHTSSPVSHPPTVVPTTPAPESVPTALVQALFSTLNAAREQAGLPPLGWSPGLRRSAAGHNQAMATADELGPRVGDEPALGVRQANQGVIASFSAESLGYADSTDVSDAMAVQQQILAEQPPDDSRRQNLLSAGIDAVGIDVLLDPAHHRIWITEDLAQLS